MPDYDDETLERIMREGLELRAGSAGTELADPPGRSRDQRSAGPRRRGRILVAAALVATVAGVGGAAAYLHRPEPGRVAVDPGPAPTAWRLESYDGVQVQVPPTWGWGGSPTRVGGETMSCGTTTAFAGPGRDGAGGAGGAPFVGRPTMMSDACLAGAGTQGWPQTDAVWLGSPLPVGTDTSGPEVAQTTEVGGQRVTVFSDDDALRSRILATAEAVQIDGNGCPTVPVIDATPGPERDPAPESLSVCVYQQGTLLWSTQEDAQHAQAYVDAFRRASATYDAATSCTTPPSYQWVAIKVDYGSTPPTRWDIANFDCPVLVGTYTATGGTHSPMEAPMTPDTVAPWAGGGIKAYVAGPGVSGDAGAALAPYFRGMLG